jgi:hypothetical protein
MTDATADYAAWIGRQEITDDDMSVAPARAAAAHARRHQDALRERECPAALVALVLFSPQSPTGLAG